MYSDFRIPPAATDTAACSHWPRFASAIAAQSTPTSSLSHAAGAARCAPCSNALQPDLLRLRPRYLQLLADFQPKHVRARVGFSKVADGDTQVLGDFGSGVALRH